MEKEESDKVYIVVQDKTIPINKKKYVFRLKEGILFDEEILINVLIKLKNYAKMSKVK